jgi:hypothetical protein
MTSGRRPGCEISKATYVGSYSLPEWFAESPSCRVPCVSAQTNPVPAGPVGYNTYIYIYMIYETVDCRVSVVPFTIQKLQL